MKNINLQNEVKNFNEGKVRDRVKIIKKDDGLTTIYVGELVNISDMNIEENSSVYTMLLNSTGKLVDVKVCGNVDKIFFY